MRSRKAVVCLLGVGLVSLAFAVGVQAQGQDPDVNGDGSVDLLDVSILSQCYGADLAARPECLCADVDGDGDVDLDDLRRVSGAYGQSGFPLDPDACTAPPTNTAPVADAGEDDPLRQLFPPVESRRSDPDSRPRSAAEQKREVGRA